MEPTIQSISNAPTAVQDKKQGLWTCEICNHPMEERSQQSHLAGKKHKAKAGKIEQPSDENSSSVHGNLMEFGSPKTGAPAGEVITGPVKLSYLRMKEQMELYGGFATKTITTNFKTPSGKEDSARDTRAVYPQTELHGEEREGDENSNSTTTDIPLAKTSSLQLRKKPGLHIAPLTDRDIPFTPPAAALVSLKEARQIQDFKSLNYPADILSPGLSQHSAGNFKYNKDFLMQFENIFTEKPLNWDKKVYGLFGDGAPLTEAARTALGLTALSSTIKKPRTSSVAGQPLNMMTSLQRFELSRAGRRPETGTSATRSGRDFVRKGPESSLKSSEPNKSRSRPGNRSSRRVWLRENGENAIDGITEPEQGDITNSAPPTADFGSFPNNNSSEREITPIPDNPPYTAHIGNLSFDIEAQEISDLFWGCDFKTVRLVRDKLNDRLKGFGYVEFNTKEGLIAATELNGVNVCGRNIRVSIARPPKTTQADQRHAAGRWRDPESTNLESLVNQTPIDHLSVVARALEESVGIRRLSVVEKPPVDRIGGWRNTTLEKKAPPKEITPKWDCVSCGISIALDKKDIHLLRHAARLKKQQQQGLGSNSNIRKDERRRSSLIRGETAEESDIDIWGGNPSDETFSNCDWES